MIGVFAIGELFIFLSDLAEDTAQTVAPVNKVLMTFKELKASVAGILRSCVSGFLVGVLPGAGATIASFIAYATKRNWQVPKASLVKGTCAA